MKALRFIVFACFALSMLSSCKQEQLDPELVSRVTGDYAFTHVVDNNQAYPIGQTNFSGRASVERKSATSVKLAWSYKQGNSSYSGSYTGVSLTDIGNDEIELRYGGKVVATASDGALYINTETSSGEQMLFIGSR